MVLNNARLERVQVGREKEIPLDESNNLWFLVIYKSGAWDSETNLQVFKEDLEKDLIENIFCVWHGNRRTNLFLMPSKFVLDYLRKSK